MSRSVDAFEPRRSGGRAGLHAAAFGLFVALALGTAGSASAQTDSGWRAACTFKSAPQGYGDMIKERNCIGQNDCQRMADAAGRTLFTAGCFGVAPSAPVRPLLPGEGRN